MESLFTIGQKVVCVDSSHVNKHLIAAPLVEGKTYTVVGIKPCSCGQVGVNVGIRSGVMGQAICRGCEGIIETGYTWWHNQNRFVPLDADRELDEAISEALKESLKIKA